MQIDLPILGDAMTGLVPGHLDHGDTVAILIGMGGKSRS
jgi:hypothetical protein